MPIHIISGKVGSAVSDWWVILRKWSLAIIVLLVAVQLSVDWALANNLLGRREWTALLDPIAHGSLAVMVLLPFTLWWRPALKVVLVALVSAVLIDLDHFIAAGSFSLTGAITLESRPMAHSLLFAFAFASVAGLIFRDWRTFALVALTLVSHVSRDGSGGGVTPLFWPSTFIWKIPYWWHYGFWTGLCLIVLGLTYRSQSNRV